MNKKDAYKQDEFVHDVLDFLVTYNKEVEILNKKYENAVSDYELEKYKNKKAIEYIEKEYHKYNKEFNSFQWWLEDLLNILKGE